MIPTHLISDNRSVARVDLVCQPNLHQHIFVDSGSLLNDFVKTEWIVQEVGPIIGGSNGELILKVN